MADTRDVSTEITAEEVRAMAEKVNLGLKVLKDGDLPDGEQAAQSSST